MSLRFWMLGFTASAALGAFSAIANSATLHEPLPPNSLERNGTPQHVMRHNQVPSQNIYLAALPDKGLHPKAAQGLKRHYSGTPVDMLRYHNDNYPTGWNQSETDLTPATVGSSSFGQLTTLNVDGNVLAQPLIVSNFQMPDGTTHNVLIVATGNNTVYAYDDQTYQILWQKNLGTQQSTGDVSCGDIQGGYGISATPVIVRNGSSATIYLIAATEPARFSFHTQLHALDLATGNDVVSPVEIAPSAKLTTGGKIHYDPQNQWTRAGLAYNNGSIYIGVGSHCDNNASNISGWVLRYDTGLNPTGKFNTIEARAGYELSSIWMSGYSPAIDPSGNVFAVTGNGNFNLNKGAKGYGESVISLSPDLNKKPLSTFTPSNWQSLNNSDYDFGSGGVMLIPTISGQKAPPMAVAAGKAGTYYLLNASALGGLQGGSSQPLQQLQEQGCWCGSAYYAGVNGGIVYYQGGFPNADPLHAFAVSTGKNPKLTEIAKSTDTGGFGGSFPVISSNGAVDNTAVVWAIERGNPTEQLKAYDAKKLGAPLFQSNAGNWSNGSRAYLSPLVANGRVYVPAAGTVTVFGLTQ